MKTIIFLYIFTFFCTNNIANSGEGHSFSTLISNNKESCKYCHRITYSYKIKAIWSEKTNDTTYKFITSDISKNKEVVEISNKLKTNKVSKLCINCHLDFSKHSKNFHPISIDARELLHNKLDADGKVGGKLPLYDGCLECSSCHNPHSKLKNYLRVSNEQLCNGCHNK